jgi:hypothetical protein
MALFASSFARLVGRVRAPTNAMLKSNICTLNKKNFQKKREKGRQTTIGFRREKRYLQDHIKRGEEYRAVTEETTMVPRLHP